MATQIIKPIFYFSVKTGNRGDDAIRESITSAIAKRINVPFSYFNIKYDELTEQRIEQLNNDGSVLFIAGSGLYSNTNTPSGWYFNCKPELFNKIKVPIFLIGLGCNNNLKQDIFGGELSDKAKKSIKLINDLASISTVRDQRTYDILKEIGVINHQLMLDPACFLEVPKVKKEKRVAINIAQHAPLLGRFDGGEEGQANRTKNLKLFAEISNWLIKKGYSIVFIAHDSLETNLIIDLKKLVPQLEWLNTDNIALICKEYSRCTMSIGLKMHSNILSFASETPFISLYYDLKSIEFLKMIGWERFGQSIFDTDIEWIKKQIKFIEHNPKYFSIYLKEQKEYYQPKFDNLIHQTCNLINTTT